MNRQVGSGGAGLRSMNARDVLAALHGSDEARTVADLAGEVRLTRPTVEAALAELVQMGWVQEVPPEAVPNRAGRRARRFRFHAAAGLLMGVDVGPHAVTCLISDLAGAVVHSEEERYDDHGDAATAWAVIRAVVERALDAVSATRVLATTVGVPAVVGPDGVIAYSVVVPGWLRAGIPSLISSSFPSDATFFDNDVKLATLAEAEWGGLRDARHAIFLLAGRQIGAGLIVNGELTRGANGAAGEIGGLDSVDWASAPVRLTDSFDPPLAIEQIFERAAEADPAAVGAVAVFARDIAEGVAALALTVDPEVVVVAGEAVLAGDAFLVPLRRALSSLCLSTPRIEPTSLGTRAVALGALARSLEHVRDAVLELPRP
ncbi:ROK family transcriptional regulator [Agromyces larvae]|uniref:ROK family transcriptional regulator n=1 Tax=Agromyces larvae TaxID=2929802 RepID=A0ABY4C191_9MICO|nr:ROK family transcriptional regulator [Agromyces larvae]UOE43706.1 ROK family transcriptional regulator [Agromyces larvae]